MGAILAASATGGGFGMEDQKTYEVLCQIHKTLASIATSLQTLAKVAMAEHPEVFKREVRPPAPPPSQS
jgi:hypothetical protein